MNKIFQNKAFKLGFLSGVLIFVASNIYDSLPKYSGVCFDCYETFGFPFKYWGTGGFVTHTDILWFGLIVDILIALIFSFIVGLIFKFVWSKITTKKLR